MKRLEPKFFVCEAGQELASGFHGLPASGVSHAGPLRTLNMQDRIMHRVAYYHQLRIFKLEKVAALTWCVARQSNTPNSRQQFLV